MLDPTLLDMTERVIKIEKLKQEVCEIDDAVMTVDPIGDSGTGKDECGICISGIDKKDNFTIHVKYLTGLKNLTGSDMVTQALSLCKKYNVKRILIETNLSLGISLFKERISTQNLPISVDAIRSIGAKKTRLIETLEVPLHSGRVSLDPEILKDKNNEYQFKTFTFANEPEPNDRLDALSFAMQYWDGRGIFRASKAYRFEAVDIGSPF
jgi:hypothetical protein